MTFRAENLCVRRAERLVLNGLSCAVEPGAAIVVEGPNGAGKSTFLRCLAGYIPAESGRVFLGDRDLAEHPDLRAASLSYVGHLDAVKPALTVTETLRETAGLAGVTLTPGAIENALADLGLGRLALLDARVLSAGQKRRLALARLPLLARPIWLLDEPTVSLDRDSALAFGALVARHRAAGGMVIAATHLELGFETAQRLVLTPARTTL